MILQSQVNGLKMRKKAPNRALRLLSLIVVLTSMAADTAIFIQRKKCWKL